MDKIIDFLKDIEQVLLIISNIITLAYGIWISIKSKKWQQTARLLGIALNKEVEADTKRNIRIPNVPEGLMSYVDKALEKPKNDGWEIRG